MSENNVPQGKIVRSILASALGTPRFIKNPSIGADPRYQNAKTPEERLEVVNTIAHERSKGKAVRDKMATTLVRKYAGKPDEPTLFTQGVMAAFKVDLDGAETIVRQAADDGHVIIEEINGSLSVRLEEKKVPTASSNGDSKLDKLKALMAMAGIG